MPSNQELEKICNVAGYPIYKWAADQLKVRSEKGSQDTRNDDNLTYLANKNAFDIYRNSVRQYALNPVAGDITWPIAPTEVWTTV